MVGRRRSVGGVTRTLADLRWPRRIARLALRPVRLEDVDAIFAYRSDPEVAQWLTALPTNLEQVAADEAKGTQAELGWCIAPAHQGQGYASWRDGASYALLAEECAGRGGARDGGTDP